MPTETGRSGETYHENVEFVNKVQVIERRLVMHFIIHLIVMI